MSAVAGGFFYVIEFDLHFGLEIRIFAPEMPFVDYKRVTQANGIRQQKPFETYTLEEAAERGIEPLPRAEWRERFFRRHEDITGQYILTNDEPSLVTPVLKCYVSNPDRPRGRGGYVTKLHLPWTHVMGEGNKVFYGVKSCVTSQQWKALYGRVTINQRKLFILLVALGCGHNKAVFAIWGLDQKVDQNWFRKRLMGDEEKMIQAAQGLAGEAFGSVGLTPKEIAGRIKKLLEHEKTPLKERIAGYFNIADRVGMKEKEDRPTDGLVGLAMLQEGSVHPQTLAVMAQSEAAKLAGGKPEVAALIESQSEEALDEQV